MYNNKITDPAQTTTHTHNYSTILSPIFAQRIARQNRVLRKLRQLGCSILATHLDTELTIQVNAGAVPLLRQQYGTPDHPQHAKEFMLWIDGCRITWHNKELE